MSNPLSDVVTLAEEPGKYARATMADPLRALLVPIGLDTERYDRRKGAMVTKPQKNFTTYGAPILPHVDKKAGKLKAGFLGSQAANYLPFGIGDNDPQRDGYERGSGREHAVHVARWDARHPHALTACVAHRGCDQMRSEAPPHGFNSRRSRDGCRDGCRRINRRRRDLLDFALEST